MEFNSGLDDKNPEVCRNNTKWNAAKTQNSNRWHRNIGFISQKFADFSRAWTQNVHLAVLYYVEKVQKYKVLIMEISEELKELGYVPYMGR